MPYDTLNRETIKSMVREFYTRILADDMLGPIFTRALGDDLNTGKWPDHFNTLDSFWVMMMTGQRGYNGDPFPPHAFLGNLTNEDFERWLEIFHKVVHEFFVEDIAEKFYKKAEILAAQFIENLGINDDDDDDW